MDAKSGYLLEKLPKSEVEDLALEEVPDIGYDDIGGLGSQIEAIKDAVELPYLYADYYKEHQLTPPKGVLLYGPPGCGKTMIAKAVANNLAEKISEKRGEKIKGFFLNIKGPELLNKYVGETERKIREIFVKAKEKAADDVPVVVFFDEMDALFRTRGTGISSTWRRPSCPMLLAEIDGVEGLRKRHRHRGQQPPGPDRSGHPAAGSPRREDQDRAAGSRRGGRHLPEVPDDPDPDRRVGEAPVRRRRPGRHRHDDRGHGRSDVQSLRGEPFPRGDLRQRRQGGLYFKDFSSGAMIESVVRRAKKLALKRLIGGRREGDQRRRPAQCRARRVQGERGSAEYDQPRRLGEDRRQEGRAIVYVKPLMGDTKEKQKNVEKVVATGQYL